MFIFIFYVLLNFVSFRLLVFVVVDCINNLTDFMLVNIFFDSTLYKYVELCTFPHFTFERKCDPEA